MIDSQTIPHWLVALFMIYTGFIWWQTSKVEIRMDTRIFAFTFLLEGMVYAGVFFHLSDNVEMRGFLSRLMIVIVCFSQALPLTVSYIRSILRGKHQ